MTTTMPLLPHEQARFWSYVERSPACWLWTGSTTGDGYGKFKARRQTLLAHRVAYLHVLGPIPDGLQLDHLCRVPSCVNPRHLEPVTPRENSLRGNSPWVLNSRKTHCPKGHAYSGNNLKLGTSGRRNCRTCARDAARRYRARKGAA